MRVFVFYERSQMHRLNFFAIFNYSLQLGTIISTMKANDYFHHFSKFHFLSEDSQRKKMGFNMHAFNIVLTFITRYVF